MDQAQIGSTVTEQVFLTQSMNLVGAGAAAGPHAPALGAFPSGLVGLPAAAVGSTSVNPESFQAQKELQNLTNLYKTQLCKHF